MKDLSVDWLFYTFLLIISRFFATICCIVIENEKNVQLRQLDRFNDRVLRSTDLIKIGTLEIRFQLFQDDLPMYIRIKSL